MKFTAKLDEKPFPYFFGDTLYYINYFHNKVNKLIANIFNNKLLFCIPYRVYAKNIRNIKK